MSLYSILAIVSLIFVFYRVHFTVSCAIILASTFVPKGAFSFNPKMISEEVLDMDIEDEYDDDDDDEDLEYVPGARGNSKESHDSHEMVSRMNSSS